MAYDKRALFACVFTCVAAAGTAARAQFFEIEAKTSHAAIAAGKPQSFTAAATQSNGAPTVVNPGGPVIVYSLFGNFSTGAPANGIALPPTTPVGVVLGMNPGVRLYGPSAARGGELKVTIPDLNGIGDAYTNFTDAGFDFENDCVRNATFNDRVGLPAETTVRACDALDSTVRLNGVSAQLIGIEDRVPLRLVIPSIGLDITGTPPAVVRGDNFVDRGDSLRALRDGLYASGKVPMLASQLLKGAPAPVKGSLPNEGTLITGEVTVGSTTKTFAIDNPGQAVAYVLVNRGARASDFGLSYDDKCFRTGATVTGACSPVTARLTVLGVEVNVSVPANSTDATFTVPALNLSFTSSAASDRDDAIGQFADYAAETVASEDLTRAYARYLAANSPSDPLVGNPFSAQGQLNRASLDLDAPSEALDETKESGGGGARARADDPSGWMVGGRVGHLSSAGQGAEFADVVIERGFRIREGSRMRLKVSLPASYIHYGGRSAGGETATFGLRASLEAPLIDGRWVVEPSAAASAFYSSDVVSSGALYSAGVSSRYKIGGIGRGHIIIGNAVNYSSTIEINAGSFASPKITNTAVRNGVAYQVPYGRFLGRQGTVRASYTFTHVFGDDILVEDYHEVSLNYGVAGREASVKQIGETLRFGLNGSFGHDFTAVSLTAGYRF